MTDDTVLYAYPREDRSLVDEELFEGRKTVTEEDLAGNLERIDVSVNMGPVRNFLDDIVAEEIEYDSLSLIDADVAPMLHQNLPLTRRQAADRRIWHYLAVVWHPNFVRYRWPYDATDRTFNSMREKFLGGGTDIYSNAFGRLWWMAELSKDPEASNPYETTREILQTQFLTNRVFDPAFARYRPAVVAFGEGLSGESTEVVGHANRRFNQALSTIQLETRDTDQLREIVERVVAGVKEDYDL
jgi:histone H3/H4